MSVSERLIRVAKFGLVAAMLTMASVLAVPAASAAPAVTAVHSIDKSDVGINASYNCSYQYDYDEFRWDCSVYSGYVRTWVRCSSGNTYYSAWWGPGSSFYQYVKCGGYWTNAGVQTSG